MNAYKKLNLLTCTLLCSILHLNAKETSNNQSVTDSFGFGGGLYAGYSYKPMDIVLNIEDAKTYQNTDNNTNVNNIKRTCAIRPHLQVLANVNNCFYIGPGLMGVYNCFDSSKDNTTKQNTAKDKDKDKDNCWSFGLSLEAGYKLNSNIALFGRAEYTFPTKHTPSNTTFSDLKVVAGIKVQYKFNKNFFAGVHAFGGYCRTKIEIDEQHVQNSQSGTLQVQQQDLKELIEGMSIQCQQLIQQSGDDDGDNAPVSVTQDMGALAKTQAEELLPYVMMAKRQCLADYKGLMKYEERHDRIDCLFETTVEQIVVQDQSYRKLSEFLRKDENRKEFATNSDLSTSYDRLKKYIGCQDDSNFTLTYKVYQDFTNEWHSDDVQRIQTGVSTLIEFAARQDEGIMRLYNKFYESSDTLATKTKELQLAYCALLNDSSCDLPLIRDIASTAVNNLNKMYTAYNDISQKYKAQCNQLNAIECDLITNNPDLVKKLLYAAQSGTLYHNRGSISLEHNQEHTAALKAYNTILAKQGVTDLDGVEIEQLYYDSTILAIQIIFAKIVPQCRIEEFKTWNAAYEQYQELLSQEQILGKQIVEQCVSIVRCYEHSPEMKKLFKENEQRYLNEQSHQSAATNTYTYDPLSAQDFAKQVSAPLSAEEAQQSIERAKAEMLHCNMMTAIDDLLLYAVVETINDGGVDIRRFWQAIQSYSRDNGTLESFIPSLPSLVMYIHKKETVSAERSNSAAPVLNEPAETATVESGTATELVPDELNNVIEPAQEDESAVTEPVPEVRPNQAIYHEVANDIMTLAEFYLCAHAGTLTSTSEQDTITTLIRSCMNIKYDKRTLGLLSQWLPEIEQQEQTEELFESEPGSEISLPESAGQEQVRTKEWFAPESVKERPLPESEEQDPAGRLFLGQKIDTTLSTVLEEPGHQTRLAELLLQIERQRSTEVQNGVRKPDGLVDLDDEMIMPVDNTYFGATATLTDTDQRRPLLPWDWL